MGPSEVQEQAGCRELEDLGDPHQGANLGQTEEITGGRLKPAASHHLFYEMLVGRASHSFNSQITKEYRFLQANEQCIKVLLTVTT